MNGRHLFIADLHLDPDTDPGLAEQPCVYADPRLAAEPEAVRDPASALRTELAVRFLEQAKGSDHLWILGDLFEYWLGDDAGVPLYHTILEALRTLSASGCTITVMLGNRDFLLDQAFAEAANVQLIRDDELVIELGAERVLLMHGDTLCTDDTDYQRFRHNVREPRWQKAFLAKSVDERQHHAQALRAASHDASVDKSADIMDVSLDAVSQRLAAHDCRWLIHGHTHRPAIHSPDPEGRQRLVVGDWHADHACFVEWDGQAFGMHRFTG